MERIRKYIISLLLLLPLLANAQTDRDYVRQGNKAFRSRQYAESEVKYRKALSVNNANPQALYNLGCALMMQNKMSESVKFFQKAASQETSKLRKSKSYHNIGVICQSGKMYQEAIKAYSEALRNNPGDNETRYNLALCKKLLKNSKQDNRQNNKQNSQDKKDKKQDSGKDKDKKDKNKDNDTQKDKENRQQPQMSKDNAEQLLNAAMQQERQTQERLNRSRQQQQTRRLEKNW